MLRAKPLCPDFAALNFGDVLYTLFMSAPILATKLYIPRPGLALSSVPAWSSG
jgi:hypothetical protein